LHRKNSVRSTIVKRPVVIAGKKTSDSLEDAFWTALNEIAAAREMTLSNWSTRSIASGNPATSHRPFASLCSTSIAIRFPSSKSATDRGQLSCPTSRSRSANFAHDAALRSLARPKAYGVRSKNSSEASPRLRCLLMIITQEAAQALAALNRPVAADVRTPREQQVTLPLMIPLGWRL
jgi:hypothetical protein